MKYLVKLFLVLILSSPVSNIINAQSFNIVSDEVKEQRKKDAQRKAYLSRVNNAWDEAKKKNTIASYEIFLANRFRTKYNTTALERIYNKTERANTIEAYDKFLSKKYKNSNYNNKTKEYIFALTSEKNTIKSYELFLSKNYNVAKFDEQAIANIYKLTAKIDAVQGYRTFLKNYPYANDAEKATARLYEIMYAIAEEENDIAGYYGFLIEFPKSQKLLREKAYINMQMLEVEKAGNEYNQNKSPNDDHELKERIARQLYNEACRAEENGDNYTFMRKYNTILYSELFKQTQAAFDLNRDRRMAKLIKQLIDEVREVNYSVNRMTRAITNKLDNMQHNINNLQSAISSQRQNDYSNYYEQMIDLQREQANDWSRYVNTGKAPTGWFGSPKSY